MARCGRSCVSAAERDQATRQMHFFSLLEASCPCCCPRVGKPWVADAGGPSLCPPQAQSWRVPAPWPGSRSCTLPPQGWRKGRVSPIPAPSREDLETCEHCATIPGVQRRQGCTLGSPSLMELSWGVQPPARAGLGAHHPECGEGAASCRGVMAKGFVFLLLILLGGRNQARCLFV